MKRIIYWKSFSREFLIPVQLCKVLEEYVKSHSLKEIDKDYFIIANRVYENNSLPYDPKKFLEPVEDYAHSKPNFHNETTTIQNYYLMITDDFVKTFNDEFVNQSDEKEIPNNDDDDDDDYDGDGDGDFHEELYIDEIDKQILDNIFMLTFLCLAGELHNKGNKIRWGWSPSIKKYPSRIKQLINKKFTLYEALTPLNILVAVFLVFVFLGSLGNNHEDVAFENVIYEEGISFYLIFNGTVLTALWCLFVFFVLTLAYANINDKNPRRFIFGVVFLFLAFASGYMAYFTHPSNRFERITRKMIAVETKLEDLKDVNWADFQNRNIPKEAQIRYYEESKKYCLREQEELRMRFEIYKAQYDFMRKRDYQKNGPKQLPVMFGIIACVFFIYAVLFLNFKLFNDSKFSCLPINDR